MKIKIIIILFIMLSATGPGEDQKNPQAKYPGILWRVEGKKIKNWLLASIPFIEKKYYPLPAALEEALKQSSSLILTTTTNITPEEQIKMSALMLQKGIYIGEMTLRDTVSKTTFSTLQNMLKEYGQNPTEFAKLKPWMAGLTLTLLESRYLNYNPEENLVYYIQQKTLNKKNIGLMQFSEIISMMDGFSREENELLLRTSIHFCKLIRKNHKIYREAWLKGDFNFFERESQNQWNDAPDLHNFQKSFDATRNRLLYNRLPEILKANPQSLMIFDIDQICGEEGLLQWLKRKGYRLIQIN
jgi:uncharacterized protein YbaP (TraB family)